ncbi:helix-turn-helix domain-containing protein [Dyadobacter sandarakinus]|uniref:AraC family transcriptional regulator n=1 Tax=Dyadobacter sandarakinus TaxID=2747268 RepID=A0ABX7I8W3_9BACT|nr:helix-turn-helix domain-containing protein [Dyadobacter sandarakinus]QRR01416.1 AraC family transcriptional regulator [Dyadobacter sandarakinus]
MQNQIIDIRSIAQFNALYDAPAPRHPLITVIDLAAYGIGSEQREASYRLDLYTMYFKETGGSMKYGRANYDFTEGSVMFTAPGQVITPGPAGPAGSGWGLFFHSDLVHPSPLGRKMADYSFFQYQANEALHVSEEERRTLEACLGNISKEYAQHIDKHTAVLIRSNLELLLNYCARFYDRQFYTREKVNADIVQQFEALLDDYFGQDHLIETSLPGVGYFAGRLNLSPNYLTDLLHRFTGKGTLDHIHAHVIDRAKNLLWGSAKPVSEIAYELGFTYPSQFTRLFKNKTGQSPSDFRTRGLA